MTRRFLVYVVIVCLTGPSGASLTATGGTARAQAPVDQETSTITITRKDCRRFIRHTARSDVTYKPGVDVYGRPVKPADLEPSGIELPDEIKIDLNVDIFDFVGNTPAPRGLSDSRARIGTITFKNGRLFFNGMPLGEEINPEILAVCDQLLKPK